MTRKKCWLAVMVIVFSVYIADAAIAIPKDSSETSLNPTNTQVFMTAYLNLNITSINEYSWCKTPGQPPDTGHGLWFTSYVACPENSIQVSQFTTDAAVLQSCICSGQSCSTTNSSVQMTNYGNLGLEISNITCFVPVQMWLPQSIVSNGGGNTSLYGYSVYISNFGTMPLIEPSQSVATFNLTVDIGAGTMSGPNYPLLSHIISPSSFQRMNPTFPGCGFGPGNGC